MYGWKIEFFIRVLTVFYVQINRQLIILVKVIRRVGLFLYDILSILMRRFCVDRFWRFEKGEFRFSKGKISWRGFPSRL